jgi:epoxyqueuosine reductase
MNRRRIPESPEAGEDRPPGREPSGPAPGPPDGPRPPTSGHRQEAALPLADLVGRIRSWGKALGFQQVGITGVDLALAEARLAAWLSQGHHGEMDWMVRHGSRRSRPAELVPGTLSVISARLDYLPPGAIGPGRILADPTRAYIARYALGRDYHKVARRRLARLAGRIGEAVGPFGYRVFVDSAPVLEKPIAERAGLGWIGKHTNLVARSGGSWFFLGEIFTDLPLPPDPPARDHCGRCQACVAACPTAAIVAPYRLDARRCVAYLTIELPGAIPIELRGLIGNRVFGCDDCQIACPWNRFARETGEADFLPRADLDGPALVDLFGWSEAEFLARTAGSVIRRLGHERWLRNLAVALGNAPRSPAVTAALRARADHPSALVREHVAWALSRHGPGRG